MTLRSDPKSLVAEIEKHSSDNKQLANLLQLLLLIPFHEPVEYVGEREGEGGEKGRGSEGRGRGEGEREEEN
jgi:hypothetical protein